MLWVNLAGLLSIVLIVYWFWLSRPRSKKVTTGTAIEILVENGVYTPARITVGVGHPVTLRFIRKDVSPCAEQVIFHGLGKSETLEVGRPNEITLQVAQAGEYRFTCQMQMYQGTLVVTP